MYLIDTDVISNYRKAGNANPGVQQFFRDAGEADIYLPVQTIGEIRGGIEKMRRRNDMGAVQAYEGWLSTLLQLYANRILDFTVDCAQVWGTFLLPKDPHAIDKQIAAMGRVYNLTVVTRNITHYTGTGATVINPFN